MRQCIVMLKDKAPPWDIRNMSDKACFKENFSLHISIAKAGL